MRRWNGWGDEAQHLDLPNTGRSFLHQRLGQNTPLADVTLDAVVAQVPPSRLPAHQWVLTDADTRIRHARGQSLPDWLAMRSGAFGCFPDGVAFPENADQIRTLLQFAEAVDALVIPYGGGTSVAGHITPTASARPILTLSLARMNRLLDLDSESLLATFGPGANGPQVESQLRARGYTLGHFPQSFELSTLGGWVATRSSGQQSLGYGRIEQLFAGGKLETPRGSLTIPAFPASAAGPDLREWALGSEGRLGVLSEVQVRVSPLPEQERFVSVFFADFEQARAAAQQLVQQKIGLSMLRVSNGSETQTQLALAGHRNTVALLERWLQYQNIDEGKCMLTFGVSGNAAHCRKTVRAAKRVCRQQGGRFFSRALGKRWAQKRFALPYLRETLWQQGYAIDTLETATNWDNVTPLMTHMESNLQQVAQSRHLPIHVFTHLSHIYPQGSSIYTTYVFPVAASYSDTLAHWQALKASTSQLIVEQGGTISHQHGVGRDHAPYLTTEKGELALTGIAALNRHFDADQRMNPGVLLTEDLG